VEKLKKRMIEKKDELHMMMWVLMNENLELNIK